MMTSYVALRFAIAGTFIVVMMLAGILDRGIRSHGGK